MIGAGGAAGQNDAANLLKPALARGELRTIAATTWSEYKKYFEKDPALARRFQVVKVEEPTEAKCEVMLRGVVPMLEKHHNVRILDEGLAAAVKFSHRYLPDRQLPDKAVSVLDTACARLSLGQNCHAAGHRRRHARNRRLRRAAARPGARSRAGRRPRRAPRRDRQAARQPAEARLAELAGALGEGARPGEPDPRSPRQAGGDRGSTAAQPPAAAGRPRRSARRLAAAAAPDPRRACAAELAALNAELDQLQGETPLMRVCVDANIVGDVVSAWTGIPIGKMLKDEVETVLSLESHLGRRVIGQDHALGMISERIRTSKASLEDPSKPIGVFLLVGPSGVGKTETALALADLLYGGERNMITINMSEFQEAHTVSTLKGSPPGYVGYGEGGVLTEAVRRRPYSVVLLDEVEKAHPDVLELFFQVFDKGMMEDGEGREIDFKNTIIILTSNAGTDTLMKLTADPETMPSSEGLVKALKPELNKIFKPAFLGRMVIIPYFPVRDEAMKQIVRLKLGEDSAAAAGDASDRPDPRRPAGGRSGEALHGSGERRAQRGQHPDQHAAARDLAPDSGPHGEAAEARAHPRRASGPTARSFTTERCPGKEASNAILTPKPTGRMQLTTPLGADALLLTAFRGREAIPSCSTSSWRRCGRTGRSRCRSISFWARRSRSKLATPAGHALLQRHLSSHHAGRARPGSSRSTAWKSSRSSGCSPAPRRAGSSSTSPSPTSSRRCSQGLDVTYEIQGDFPAARLLRAVPRDRFQLRQPADGRGRHLLLLQAHRTAATRWCWPTRRRSIPTFRTRPTVDLTRRSAAIPATRTAITDWRRRRRSAPASSRSGTTRFELPTSTWRPRRPIQDSVQVGTGHPQAEGRRQRQAGDLRLPRRLRPAVRRRRPGRRRASRPTCRRSSTDNMRTVGIRMQQEALPSLLIEGASGHAGFTAGPQVQPDRALQRRRQATC